MYKKLEKDSKTVLTAEKTPEAECNCACGTSEIKNEEPQPEANTLAVHLPENYRING